MDSILYYICLPLGYLMKLCWMLVGNYGLAIILFTLAIKVVLLPISVWIHKNSIRMVKMQPQINFLKAKHYGNTDAIADEQAKLFKSENYHPMLSLVPLVLQLVLLMGVVNIIYHPMGYLFGFSSDVSVALANFIGQSTEANSFELHVIAAIQDGTISAQSVIPGVSAGTLSAVVEKVGNFDLSFIGYNLTRVPSQMWSTMLAYIAVPLAAGLSSWVLCFTQNLANVIQHEQNKLSQYGLMAVSVGISLYLGCFVPAGVALYWVASNLFSVAQMYTLNAVINPKKYVDYEALEESRKALADIEALEASSKKDENYRENKARERKDYKRFMKIANKHLVFYSEGSGFYKYFKELIEQLLERSTVTIHYVTNDPNDVIFEIAKEQPRIKPYYIGLKKTITLMMMLETDIMVMTTPDLDKYYIKRSYIKKDIEYIYVNHGMNSVHMSLSEGSLDAFDTIFCPGPHVYNEIRATEKVYGLPEKTLVEFGHPHLDNLIRKAKEELKDAKPNELKEILIAPSWGEDNILDSCIDVLIEKLYRSEYHITVRPHPEYVKRYSAKMQKIVDRYADYDKKNLSFELDFSVNKSIYSSDLIISDWSGVASEFCFATDKPALFINTDMKVVNPNWEKINMTPSEIFLRDEIGVSMNKEDLDKVGEVVEKLLNSSEYYAETIKERYDYLIYNHNTAAKAGAKYILSSLAAKQKASKEAK